VNYVSARVGAPEPHLQSSAVGISATERLNETIQFLCTIRKKKKSNLEVRVEGDMEVGLHVVQRRCKIMGWVVWSNSARPVDIVTR
jgi:hypothetical protein